MSAAVAPEGAPAASTDELAVDAVEQPALPAAPRTRAALMWAYVLTVGRYAITGILFLWLATIITPAQFGSVAIAMVWVTFVQMLGYNGPAHAVIQRQGATTEHFNAAFWFSTVTGTAMAGIFAALAPLWARANGDPELRNLCWALTPAILLNALVVVPESVLRRHMEFKRISVRVLLAGLVSGVVGIAMAVAGFGVWALVAQQVVLSGVSAVTVLMISPWKPAFSFRWQALRDLRRFSAQSVAEFTSYFVSVRADLLVLGMFFGPAAIGLYRLATRLTDMVGDIASGGLSQVSLPHLARFHTDVSAFVRTFSKMVHAGALLGWPTFAVVGVAAPDLIAVVGPQWTAAVPALQVACVDGAIGILGGILAPANQAAGKPGINATVGWIQAPTTVAVIALVGTLFAHTGSGTQALAVALTFATVRFIFLLGIGIYCSRVVFRTSMLTLLRPAQHALVAALLAVVAGQLTVVATRHAPAAVGLLLTVAAALAVAGLYLLVRDPLVGEIVRRVLRRRGAPTPVA